MFQFVTIDSSGRLAEENHALIRKVAATGRNRNPDSRRSRRDAKRHARLEKETLAKVGIPPPPPNDLSLVSFAENIGPESQGLVHQGKPGGISTSTVAWSVDSV